MQSRRPQIIVSKIALRPQIAKPVRHECGVFVVSIGEAEPHLPVNVGPQKLFGWKTDTTFLQQFARRVEGSIVSAANGRPQLRFLPTIAELDGETDEVSGVHQ